VPDTKSEEFTEAWESLVNQKLCGHLHPHLGEAKYCAYQRERTLTRETGRTSEMIPLWAVRVGPAMDFDNAE
jgi:hypothetical protein